MARRRSHKHKGKEWVPFPKTWPLTAHSTHLKRHEFHKLDSGDVIWFIFKGYSPSCSSIPLRLTIEEVDRICIRASYRAADDYPISQSFYYESGWYFKNYWHAWATWERMKNAP